MKMIRNIFTATLLLIAFTTNAQDYNPFKSIGKKGKILTLSKGKYVEVFDYDTIQRIGTVLFNIRTKKIVKLLDADKTFEKFSDNSSASRWYSPDPLADKYAQHSPYVFVADNPIRYNDPDGQELVDPNGKHISVRFNKNGTLTFSKNATAHVKRIANALNLTATGRTQLRQVIGSDVKVKMNISSETVTEKKPNGDIAVTYGQTVQGNYNEKDNYGRQVNADGTYGIKEATIAINEGSIGLSTKSGSSREHEGLTMEQAIGAVAGHEIVHATNKSEINKDLKAEMAGGQQAKDREKSKEIKPQQVENKIIDQSKNLNE